MAPLDLAHTPALLQLAQAAANEVDTTGVKASPTESAVVVDVIAESTQQVVNQLSEVVANAKQNDIQGSNSSPAERGASTTAKPEEDLLDIVESFIAEETEDDDDDEEEVSTEEQKQTPETTQSPSQAEEAALPQNDKDEINDEVEEEDDLSRE